MNDKYFGIFLLILFVMMGCAGRSDYDEKKRHDVSFKQCK